MRLPLLLAVAVVLPFAAEAETGKDCAALSDDTARLACYDLIFKSSAPEMSTVSKWNVTTMKSKIDDSTNVLANVDALEPVRGRFGGEAYPTLWLMCRENKTSLYMTFAGHHMSDHSSYGDVTFRLDNTPAFSRRTGESTDNKALGLWDGGTAVPFIKNMFGHDILLVRATPYGESALTIEFPITGVEKAVEQLRQACGW